MPFQTALRQLGSELATRLIAQLGGASHIKGVEVVPLVEETVAPLCAPALARSIKKPTDLLEHTLIRSDVKQVP